MTEEEAAKTHLIMDTLVGLAKVLAGPLPGIESNGKPKGNDLDWTRIAAVAIAMTEAPKSTDSQVKRRQQTLTMANEMLPIIEGMLYPQEQEAKIKKRRENR